jgi:hypothetical protein
VKIRYAKTMCERCHYPLLLRTTRLILNTITVCLWKDKGREKINIYSIINYLYGQLKGKALRKAKLIVDVYGSSSMEFVSKHPVVYCDN